MLDFPSGSYAFLAIPFVMMALLAISYIIYKYLQSNGINNLFVVIAVGFISLSAIFCGAFFSITHSLYVYKFRNIQISEVSGLRVYESKRESNINKENYIEITDKNLIKEMLESLKECTEFSPGKETFKDGYQINLLFDNKNFRKDFYISVYKNSLFENGNNSIIPHITSDRSVNLGNYQCQTFQKLTRKHIDPLFSERSNQTQIK